MRNTFVIVLASMSFLTACMPLPQMPIQEQKTSSAAISSAASAASIELPMEQSSSSPSTGSGSLPERLTDRGILEIGKSDAPHTLTVFTNYSCEYCSEFFRDMLEPLQQEFMDDGSLKMQIVIIPLQKYKNSLLEAAALTCGTVLGKGQEIHTALIKAPLRDRKSLLAFAKKLTLSEKEFGKCLDAKETKALLEQQKELIDSNQVTLIPAFMLNNQRQTGLPSSADLRGWISSIIRANP